MMVVVVVVVDKEMSESKCICKIYKRLDQRLKKGYSTHRRFQISCPIHDKSFITSRSDT